MLGGRVVKSCKMMLIRFYWWYLLIYWLTMLPAAPLHLLAKKWTRKLYNIRHTLHILSSPCRFSIWPLDMANVATLILVFLQQLQSVTYTSWGIAAKKWTTQFLIVFAPVAPHNLSNVWGRFEFSLVSTSKCVCNPTRPQDFYSKARTVSNHSGPDFTLQN